MTRGTLQFVVLVLTFNLRNFSTCCYTFDYFQRLNYTTCENIICPIWQFVNRALLRISYTSLGGRPNEKTERTTVLSVFGLSATFAVGETILELARPAAVAKASCVGRWLPSAMPRLWADRGGKTPHSGVFSLLTLPPQVAACGGAWCGAWPRVQPLSHKKKQSRWGKSQRLYLV